MLPLGVQHRLGKHWDRSKLRSQGNSLLEATARQCEELKSPMLPTRRTTSSVKQERRDKQIPVRHYSRSIGLHIGDRNCESAMSIVQTKPTDHVWKYLPYLARSAVRSSAGNCLHAILCARQGNDKVGD